MLFSLRTRFFSPFRALPPSPEQRNGVFSYVKFTLIAVIYLENAGTTLILSVKMRWNKKNLPFLLEGSETLRNGSCLHEEKRRLPRHFDRKHINDLTIPDNKKD